MLTILKTYRNYAITCQVDPATCELAWHSGETLYWQFYIEKLLSKNVKRRRSVHRN